MVLALTASGCSRHKAPAGAGPPTTAPPTQPAASRPASPVRTTTPRTTGPTATGPAPTTTTTLDAVGPVAAAQPVDGQPPAIPAAPNGGPVTLGPIGSGPLSGQTVAVDPGHNGDNFAAPSVINALIFNGREAETCDTTGTETDGGYTEAQFNFNVASYLEVDLRALGATVVLTRSTNTGVGPCVTERAAIGNDAHADAAISIHADGGPADGRGFAILEPVADGPNDGIINASDRLAVDLRSAFVATGEPYSTYDGTDALQPRDDLGGTNLSAVPKVFIECANMRNATDAALLVQPSWQASAAEALARGLAAFLTGAPAG